jgi:hypothetical protein
MAAVIAAAVIAAAETDADSAAAVHLCTATLD